MKRLKGIISLVALIVFMIVNDSAKSDTVTFPPSAIAALVNHSLVAGHVYLISRGSGLNVFQTTDNGVLANIDYGFFNFGKLPDKIFIKTSQQFVDNDILPPMCGKYTGIFRYSNLLRVATAVRSFQEVSCSPYLKVVHERPAKNLKTVSSKSESPKNSPKKDVYEQNHAYTYEDKLLLDIKLLSDADKGKLKFVPIDTSRWQKVYALKKTSFWIDTRTVKKEIIGGIRNEAHPVVVDYIFWQDFGMPDNKFLRQPNGSPLYAHQSKVSCFNKTFDGADIPPESMQEAMYNFFCHSADALNTPGSEEAAFATQNQRMQEQQKQQQEQQHRVARQTAIMSTSSLLGQLFYLTHH